MALEDILRKIEADAQAEAGAILGAARAERDRLLGEAAGRAQAAAQRIMSAGRTRAEEAKRKELATASVEVRRLVLKAKQDVLNEVFEQALDRLAGIPDSQYRDLLADLAAAGSSSGTEEIVVSQRDRDRLGDGFPDSVNERLEARGIHGNVRYASRTRPLRGGLILVAGDIEINMSFERTLASLRDSMEPEIAAKLFAETPVGASR